LIEEVLIEEVLIEGVLIETSVGFGWSQTIG